MSDAIKNNVSEYIETSSILKKFKRTRQTLWRWAKREVNPFPSPRIGQDNKNRRNKWALEDVLQWEQRERG